MNWMFRLMGPRWWGAFAVLTAFVLVFRTSSVDAPAEARDRAPSLDRHRAGSVPVDPLITGHDTRVTRAQESVVLMEQVEELERSLRAERQRSRLLDEERATLQRQFDALTSITLDLLEGEAPAALQASDLAASTPLEPEVDFAPAPIEAIYVRPVPSER